MKFCYNCAYRIKDPRKRGGYYLKCGKDLRIPERINSVTGEYSPPIYGWPRNDGACPLYKKRPWYAFWW